MIGHARPARLTETDRSLFRIFFVAAPLISRRNPPFRSGGAENGAKYSDLFPMPSTPMRRRGRGRFRQASRFVMSLRFQPNSGPQCPPSPWGRGLGGGVCGGRFQCRTPASVRRRTTPPLAPPPRGGGFEQRPWGTCGKIGKCHDLPRSAVRFAPTRHSDRSPGPRPGRSGGISSLASGFPLSGPSRDSSTRFARSE